MTRHFLIKLLSLNIIIFSLLFVTKTSYAVQLSPPGMGFGVCHWPGTYGMKQSESSVNWFYWGGGGQDWNKIETLRGVYDFSAMDSEIATHFTSKPNTYFWLNILTAMPSTVPDWAKQDPSLGYIELSSTGKASTFPIWNSNFQTVFTALLTKVSEHIYSSDFKYRDKIKAVIMMSGGSFGEMITWADCSNNSDKCNKYLAAGYTDDVYFNALVNWLTPLYIRLFPDYPIVLQLGGGIYGNNTGGRVAEALVNKYGSRMFIKWNGWNRKYAQEPTNTDRAYHNALKSVANRARVGLEPGYAWAIPDTETDEMRQSIYDSIMKTLEDVPVSFFCLQDKYYQILTSDQLHELSIRMRGINTAYPTFPPQPTATPTISPTPTSLPSNPDVDNDGSITMIDYYYVVLVKIGGTIPLTMNADINNDGKIDSIDLKIMATELTK